MRRRTFITSAVAAAGALLTRSIVAKPGRDPSDLTRIRSLADESPARAEIRSERGGPRLFLNGREVYPLLALATHLYPTIGNFRAAGITIFNPILGMRSMWQGPGRYDWSVADRFFERLLELHPSAFFLPRLQINTPAWWKEAHPEERILYGIEDLPPQRVDILRHNDLVLTEGGHYFGTGGELWEASLASESWRTDTEAMIRAFVRHIEESPLRSRVIGYHPSTGRTGEWNYFGASFLPDYCTAMQAACGPVPPPADRTTTTFGLLRDPARERPVIDFYLGYHDAVAESALRMCRAIHEASDRRALAGIYYGYLLEQVRIQEGGYLAARRVFDSPDVDFIVGPYSYQPGNVRDDAGVRVTMADGAGNLLGHARGVAGDGGFRMMTESLRRRGKLYLSEMDPSTYRDASPHSVIGGHGGRGSETLRGSQLILQRDLGQVFATGVGGWLYDFGPINNAPDGWYGGPAMIGEMKRFALLGKQRVRLDISPVSQIAAALDPKTFAATEHWTADRPWEGYGIGASDFINHWFINTQARAYHRIGAPMDFLFHHDLRSGERYRLLLLPNLFYLTADEERHLRTVLRGSGMTVVWSYAPGFVADERLDLARMESLTGFAFEILREPGPMMIRCDPSVMELRFGSGQRKHPRFAVTGETFRRLGYWEDTGDIAFAATAHEGFQSVYVGTGPLPQQLLRWLAREAGADLWSSEPDIVRATRGAAMIVATGPGTRTVRFPSPMVPEEGGTAGRVHTLDLDEGESRIFLAP